MSRKVLVRLSLLVVVIFTAAFSVWGFAAAQEQAPQPPYLGIRLAPADNGIEVRAIEPDSPAAAAGLEAGDLITQIDGKDVTADSIRDLMAGYAVGDQLSLTVQRGGETLDLSATLSERPMAQRDDNRDKMQRIERPILGVQLEDSDAGVTVREVVAGSPAEKAGFEVGDVITQIGETEVKTAEEAVNAVRSLNVGDEVSITVQRAGEAVTLTATLEGMTIIEGSMGNIPLDQMPMMSLLGSNGRLGVEFVTLDEQVAKERNVTETEGALVTVVATGSPAEEAGLMAGDVITGVNNEPVDAERTLRDRLIAYEPGDVVTLAVQRDGETLSIEATLGEPEAGFGGMGGMIPFFHGGEGNGFSFQIPVPNDQSALPAGPNA